MRETTKNIEPQNPAAQAQVKDSSLLYRMIYLSFLCVISICIIFSTSGCMPTANKNVNTDLFKSKEEMKQKTAQLKRGLKKEEVFEILNVPLDKFEQLDTQQVQNAIYGNSLVQGSPAQLEKFKQKLLAYEGYALPYRSLESSSSLGLGKMKNKTVGHDLRLVVIFEKGKLLKAAVNGTANINQKSDQYLWSNILKTGVKAAF